MKLLLLVCTFCIFLPLRHYVYGVHCDKNHVGTTECVLLEPYYHKKQWGTCLTNTYIKQLSQTRQKHHHCRDIGATYCWYQCMLELNDLAEGPVYQNCICGDSNSTTLSPMSTVPTLPDWCYSPDGTSCNWYRQCLEKAKPCSGQTTDYAIKYAERFCELYQAHYNSFSPYGQRWIDLVRRCLQVKLVPVLRQWRDVTCQMIRDQAFDSHSPCYVYPNRVSDQYSFCNLPYLDNWKVFWTIKSGLLNEPIESMKGLLETFFNCKKRFGSNLIVKLIKLKVAIMNLDWHYRRSTVSDDNVMAWRIANSIAQQFSWDNVGISWYAFLSNGTASNVTDINILLGSKYQLDLSSPNAPVADLNRTVDEVGNAVENNQLRYIPNSVRILKFNGCLDIHCNETYAETTPLPVINKAGEITVTTWLRLAFMTTCITFVQL